MTSIIMRVPARGQSEKSHPFGSIFEKWVADYPKKFGAHLPHRISRTATGSHYSFTGIVKELSLYIGEDGQIMMIVTVRGTQGCFDILRDWDVLSVKVPKGYACGLCALNARKVYPTRECLFIKHSFEALALWIRSHFKPRHFLILTRNGGVTAASITSSVPKGAVAISVIKSATTSRSPTRPKRRMK